MSEQPSAAFFAGLSRDLMKPDEEQTLQTVVERAVDVIPGCDDAGVSLRRRRGRVETVGSTSELVEECDQFQYDLGEGPCLDAIWEADAYFSPDLAHDGRWPRWGPKVADRGMVAIISVKLAGDDETLGALNLYSRAGYRPDDVDVALTYAAHASNALVSAHLVSGLQSAVHGRHLIGVAQGILMHRHSLTMEQAFLVLRRVSSHQNVKLRELASQVIEQGGLPGLGDSALPQEP